MYINAWENVGRIHNKLKTMVTSGESSGYRAVKEGPALSEMLLFFRS